MKVGIRRTGFASLLLLLLSASTPVAADELDRLVERVGRTRWTAGNRLQLLVSPEESWQARLELIRRAQSHVFISTFSWHNDEHGRQFRNELARLLADRRRSNPDFEVYCLVDSSARAMSSVSFSALERAGAKVVSFNRASWGVSAVYEGRMHDKLIIVDGRWAVVSGRNFASEYFDPGNWWLDFGVLLEGDIVQDVQMTFLKSWAVARYTSRPHRFFWPEETLHDHIRRFWLTGRFPGGDSPLEDFLSAEFFPEAAGEAGGVRAALLYDNPLVWRRAATTDLLIELFADAEREIDLMTPFPNLPPELTEAIVGASLRGVRVRLFTNGDKAAIRGGPFLLAGLPTVIRLVDAGAEVWVWSGDGAMRRKLEEIGCRPVTMPPSALHGKMARIDDEIAIIHSSNFNIRSTFYNTEAGVVMRDRELNRQLRDLVDQLVSLQDLELACGEEASAIVVEQVVERLGTEDLPRLRKRIGGSQGFIDSMGVLW